MKKFAMLLAAGVIALGASAQAAPVESVTYAVITVPIVGNNGYNFIGAAVRPLEGNLSGAVFANGEERVLMYNGSGYEPTTAGVALQNLGDAVVYTNNAAADPTMIYEVGVALTESASASSGSVTIGSGFTLVSSPFAHDWTLADTDLNNGSFNRYGAKANKVHIWTGSGWQTWWFKATTAEATTGDWKCKDTSVTTKPTIGAAQAVLIERGSSNTRTSVTFRNPGAAQQ